MKQKKGRSLLIRLAQLAVLAGIFYLVFHKNYRQILADLRAVGLPGLAVLLALGGVMHLLDGLALYRLAAPRLAHFSLGQAVTLSYIGVFANITTCGTGTFPLQGYYLHRCGMMMGEGLGTILVSYTLHKTMVVATAAGLWLLAGPVLGDGFLVHCVTLGFCLSLVIVAALLLSCTFEPLHRLIRRLLLRLPDIPQWQGWRQSLLENLDALYAGAQTLLHTPANLWATVGIHAVKMLWMAGVTVVGLHLLQIPGLTPAAAMALTALSLVVAGVLPSVGGMGPTELAFLLLFTPWVGSAPASSLMILFRCATCFLPFFVSVPVAGRLARQLRVTREGQAAPADAVGTG